MATNTSKIISILSTGFIFTSILGLLSVSSMALLNPQSVMDLVQVKLPNTDAMSSIRGAYGGLGLAITISLIYLTFKNQTLAIGFLVMFWGFYAMSRTITIFSEGQLGTFGKQWLYIELCLCLCASILLWLKKAYTLENK